LPEPVDRAIPPCVLYSPSLPTQGGDHLLSRHFLFGPPLLTLPLPPFSPSDIQSASPLFPTLKHSHTHQPNPPPNNPPTPFPPPFPPPLWSLASAGMCIFTHVLEDLREFGPRLLPFSPTIRTILDGFLPFPRRGKLSSLT